MVIHGNIGSNLEVMRSSFFMNIYKQFSAKYRMGFNYLELLGAETAIFMENRIRNSHLADIVQRTDPSNFLGKLGTDPKFRTVFAEIPGK